MNNENYLKFVQHDQIIGLASPLSLITPPSKILTIFVMFLQGNV